MKRTKIDLSEEKHILTNMITNTAFLKQIKDICKTSLFETTYARVVSNWIWEYYGKTDRAPGKDIQDLYLRKRSEIEDEEDLELIADFLHTLNEYYQQAEINNIQYEVHKAESYFKLRSLEELSQKIGRAVTSKDATSGERLVSEYKRIEKPSGEGVDLFNDAGSIKLAFDFTEEHLFKYPGALGEQLGYFSRGDFFAILAPVKRGKTFYLWDIARYASLYGFKALFISLEMTQNQMVRRAWQSYVGEPFKACTVEIPEFREGNHKDKWRISRRKQVFEGIDLDEIEAKQELYRKQAKGEIRLQSYPAGFADMETLEACITNLEYYDGFVPDVIVIDYADIIKGRNRDYRQQLNEIWVRLRGWAQERNCLIVTASQTSKQALSRDAKAGDVAEDMRKLATVTKMMALNQNEKEKSLGVMRIEPLLYRDGRLTGKQICVLENRDISRVYLDSRMVSEVEDYQDGTLILEGE